MSDEDGEIAWWAAAAFSGAAWEVGFHVVESMVNKKPVTWQGVGNAAAKGAVTGVALGAIGKAVSGATKVAKIAKSTNKITKSTSALQKASNAAFKASKKVSKFSVSAKHLANSRGRYAKFSTSSQKTIRQWITTALNSNFSTFHSNKNDSYYILHNFGKKIGSKGEKNLKIVFDTVGNIWTVFPVK
jgi:septal ring-binding cell division protein DamX